MTAAEDGGDLVRRHEDGGVQALRKMHEANPLVVLFSDDHPGILGSAGGGGHRSKEP
ncbi:hypothetical protein D3C78_1262160 [compost metagenome]